MVSCEMTTERTRKLCSICLSALLLVVGALCLVIHFEIYRQTSASTFVNRPEFYYNRFVIRDISGQWIKDVSLAAGFWSYITAFLSVSSLCWGAILIVVAMKRRRTANKSLQAAANAPSVLTEP